ncbi:hypothetical protein LXL04_007407 [Taraxacum kok-saghyz]
MSLCSLLIPCDASSVGMLPVKRSLSDDDFVRTPPRHCTKVVQVSIESFPCLNTRFAPERLIQTLELLNDQQKSCVESIGFGSSLTMRLGKPPRMLSYWLVDRGIRLKHVIEKIVNDSEAGPFFIMNFLVLYVSVMIGFPSMGTLFFLMFTKVDQGSIEVKTHPLIYWTTKRLKDTEFKRLLIYDPHIGFAGIPTDGASHGIRSEHNDITAEMKKEDEHMSLENIENEYVLTTPLPEIIEATPLEEMDAYFDHLDDSFKVRRLVMPIKFQEMFKDDGAFEIYQKLSEMFVGCLSQRDLDFMYNPNEVACIQCA